VVLRSVGIRNPESPRPRQQEFIPFWREGDRKRRRTARAEGVSLPTSRRRGMHTGRSGSAFGSFLGLQVNPPHASPAATPSPAHHAPPDSIRQTTNRAIDAGQFRIGGAHRDAAMSKTKPTMQEDVSATRSSNCLAARLAGRLSALDSPHSFDGRLRLADGDPRDVRDGLSFLVG